MADDARPRIRLHLDQALAAGGRVALAGNRAHYLRNVMRQVPGDAIALFNASAGEWRAVIEAIAKARVDCVLREQTRPPGGEPPLALAFAPVKRAATDLIVETATELGATRLRPVITRRTETRRLNLDRLRAIAIEASEQCGRLDPPAVDEPIDLPALLTAWPEGERLIHLDTPAGAPPLLSLAPAPDATLLIGPEGGFDDEERALMAATPGVETASLGPTTLRAETAAIAALAVWRAGALARISLMGN